MKISIQLLSIVIVIVCHSINSTAQDTKNDAGLKTNVVATSEKTIRLLSSEYSASWPVHFEIDQFHGGKIPVIEAKEGNTLVSVAFEADFPKGKEWVLFAFALKSKAMKDQLFHASGFTLGAQVPPTVPFTRLEKGAIAILDNSNNVTLLANPVDNAGQITFPFSEWPGGKATVTMFYEVPTTATHLELVRLQIGEIRRDSHETISPDKSARTPPSKEQNTKPSGWLAMSEELSGQMEVRVKNPNEFKVKVRLRSDGKGKDFTVPADDIQSVRIPNGHYDIYFQYSTDPEGLYQGDSFTLNDNGVEIQIVKVVNGNYGIRKVK